MGLFSFLFEVFGTTKWIPSSSTLPMSMGNEVIRRSAGSYRGIPRSARLICSEIGDVEDGGVGTNDNR